ncbi:MAG: tRNA-specific adenosine deaminase [candidate division Zixibacteria bacterium RBG_16_43_9]|nr:MAG: tRNA-specific adenosine deaminase [candidate division Zixibacteria bacterium RBG_16_43_9]
MAENQDEKWMRVALQEANLALKKKEVPVGAVVVYQDKVIGRGHNQTETLNDPTAHAEILAIGAAANYLNSWRLSEAVLYVTLEPCAMCAGAIVLARMKKLVFGAFDPKAGACGSLYNLVQDKRLNHQVEVVPEILKEDCSALLQTFFKELREVRNEP